MNKWKRALIIPAIAGPLFLGCYAAETGKHGSEERMKNGAAVIVTGLAAQQAYGESAVDATVSRPMGFSSQITGKTTRDTIDVRMHIVTGDNRFGASRVNGKWAGAQDKYMFDWNVTQVDEHTYKVERVGLDSTLHLTVQDGNISGRLEKPFAFDYAFSGSIRDGQYDLTIDIPAGLDWTVKGTVQKQ